SPLRGEGAGRIRGGDVPYLKDASLPPRPDGDPNFAERADLEAVARPDQRGRSIFLDQGGAFARKPPRERGAVIDLRRDGAALLAEIDRARSRLRPLHLRAW